MQERATYLHAARQRTYGAKLRDPRSLNNTQLNKLFKANMLVDKAHRVMFCYVAKAGSTSYKSILIELSVRYKETFGNESVMDQVGAVRDIHDRGFMAKYGIRRFSSYSYEEKLDILANYQKVMAVRHPLDRLYSMYFNKLRQPPAKNAPDYQKKFGLPIALALRPKGKTKGLKRVTDITFHEFVTYFSRHPEMARDIHLKKSADWCQMHVMDYDYFMKLETVDTDEKIFIENIMKEKQFKDFHLNKVSSNSQDGWAQNNFTKLMKAYNGLDKDVFNRVKSFYQIDMDLFGYDASMQDNKEAILQCRTVNSTTNSVCC